MTLDEAINAKDLAYWERNQLVAALSKIYPSWLGKHDPYDENWEKDWRNIVFIEIPTIEWECKYVQGGFMVPHKRQLSWHIHDTDLQNFNHLEYKDHLKGKGWDGHKTEEKYRRLKDIKKRKKFLGLF